MNLDIKKVTAGDRQFWDLLENYSPQIDLSYYEGCFERQSNGDLDIYVASLDCVGFVGHCILNWYPRYALFKKLGIPEIQDLNVLNQHRRQGIGRFLIDFCEKETQSKGGSMIGIGVGLNARFGSAQRLYVKMGYVPDGMGVSYDRKQIGADEFKPIDDFLCLMMTKDIS